MTATKKTAKKDAARKPKPPALPPVLPLVAIPYVSPGQIARLKQYHMSYLEDVVLDLFAADNVAKQYEALDEMRRRLLIYIDGQPIDDPRAVPDVPVAAPAPDHAPDAGTMVAGPVAFAGMTALEAFDGIAGALGFVRAEPAGPRLTPRQEVDRLDAYNRQHGRRAYSPPPVCATCHAAARDLCACSGDGDGDVGTGGAT